MTLPNSPLLEKLLKASPLPPLDAGEPNRAAYSDLKSLTADALFAPAKVKDRSMANCCLAGLWLQHNYLNESHELSQQIETSAGSAWHGLMHRREGDFWNANYWFARVRDASLFSGVSAAFGDAGDDRASLPPRLGKLLDAAAWSPKSFTDAVEQILSENDPDPIEAAQKLAAAEWRALFNACWTAAVQ